MPLPVRSLFPGNFYINIHISSTLSFILQSRIKSLKRYIIYMPYNCILLCAIVLHSHILNFGKYLVRQIPRVTFHRHSSIREKSTVGREQKLSAFEPANNLLRLKRNERTFLVSRLHALGACRVRERYPSHRRPNRRGCGTVSLAGINKNPRGKSCQIKNGSQS